MTMTRSRGGEQAPHNVRSHHKFGPGRLLGASPMALTTSFVHMLTSNRRLLTQPPDDLNFRAQFPLRRLTLLTLASSGAAERAEMELNDMILGTRATQKDAGGL